MIRINLLPDKDARRGSASQAPMAVIILMIVVEVLALFTWQEDKNEQLSAQQSLVKKAADAVVRLEKAQVKLEKREEDKVEVARQNVVFDRMKDAKSGPSEMLKFLAYVLTRREDNAYNRDELTAQEAAGWSSGWDPGRVWLKTVVEDVDRLNIKGLAKSHEDVAEFYRRLESGIHFLTIDPVVQEVTSDSEFKELELVSFEVVSRHNYNMDGQLKMTMEEVPESLKSMVKAPEKPPEDPKKKKEKKGGH